MNAFDHDQFVTPPATPRYLAPAVRESLEQRSRSTLEQLRDCHACPRDCGVHRLEDQRGVCETGRLARVASAFPHFGEENCLRGQRGSGTIFFAMCNLRCAFCQNWDISQVRGVGREMSAKQLADIMLDLQRQGCHNINWVTPSHVVPQLIEALARAVERGLRLPIVYNTSAYDTLDSLSALDGLIDIYMPDFKFWSSETARQLANAADYPERARDAIREMHRQVGDLCFTADGVAQRGVLVRHLVMPGQLADSRKIFEWFAREVSPHTHINIMGQYHPEHRIHEFSGDRGASPPNGLRELNRRPRSQEIEQAYAAARAAGLWRFDERDAPRV